ncbi:hypothetical protein [Nocardiopsis sp. CA-288880]|uniref:hypothetical protein n=1 Tax=Nocardiopsis sp. CA-288880 TaxID=3239995 RepID=UPI003D97E162
MADIPSTGHVGEVRAQRFAMRGEGIGERSSAFVAFARQQVDAGRKVVALYPAWRSEDAERAINFARGSMRTDHVAGIAVDLSPLALSLIADQLAYLAPYLPPGMVAALCDELPRHLLAGAWLKTVSGLSTIPTSMRQHMGSFAPSVSFLAYCAPTARVGRLRPADVSRTLPFRPVQPVQLLCSTPDPSITGVFDDNLPQAIQPVATRTLPVQPLGPVYWGTSRYVEFVALSAHPQALAYAAGAVRASYCSWCGEPMSGRPCPFCSADNPRTGAGVRTPQTSRPPVPESAPRPQRRPSPGPAQGPVEGPSPGHARDRRRAGPVPSDPPSDGAPPPPGGRGASDGRPIPPTADRPEGAPFAGRALWPGTPRTYSR